MKSLISLKHFAESLPSSVTSVAIVSNHTNPVTDHTLYKEWVTHVFRGIDVKDIITDDSHTAQKSDIKCNEKLRETMFGALNKLESAGVNKCKVIICEVYSCDNHLSHRNQKRNLLWRIKWLVCLLIDCVRPP